MGTQAELCGRLVGGSVVQLTVEQDSSEAMDAIKNLENVSGVVKKEGSNVIEVLTQRPHQMLGSIVATAVNHGVKIGSVEIKEPNLEALFLQLTGRSLRD